MASHSALPITYSPTGYLSSGQPHDGRLSNGQHHNGLPPNAYTPSGHHGRRKSSEHYAPSPQSSLNPLTALPPHYSSDGGDHVVEKKSSQNLRAARAALGLHPSAPIDEDHDTAERQKLFWSKVKITMREPFTEFFGVLVFILFGDGSVAQVLLSTGETTAPGGMGFGNYQSINWGWGLGIMLGIYVAGDSGAFLNPAVTFCNCLYRQLPWRRFPVYLIAQILGAFAGSGIVYANYYSAIDWYEGGSGIRTVPPSPKATAGIFATYPQPFLSKPSEFFSEFIASAILMFVIFALKDPSNNGVPKSDKWFPLCLFFLIFGIGSCFGWQTGYAINLARDLGPRMMSACVGYPREVWTAGGYYFWIPMVAPFLGCMFGGFLYDLFIYTGPSPVNTPWIGLKYILNPRFAIQERRDHQRRNKELGLV